MSVITKKLPVSQSGKGEFVVPDPNERSRGVFLGIESGTVYRTAAVSYIGREVSAHEVAEKFSKHCPTTLSESELVQCFELYLRKIQAFKVGNILKIEHSEDGGFELSCVSRFPSRNRSRKLPG